MNLPVNGHNVGAHRSAPEASGLTEVYVTQTPEGPPAVEFERQGRSMLLPSTEARWLGAAVGELFRRTGLDAAWQPEPGS